MKSEKKLTSVCVLGWGGGERKVPLTQTPSMLLFFLTLKVLSVFTCFSKSELTCPFQEFHFMLTPIFTYLLKNPACVCAVGRVRSWFLCSISPRCLVTGKRAWLLFVFNRITQLGYSQDKSSLAFCLLDSTTTSWA